MEERTIWVLLLWTACVLSSAGWLYHYVWRGDPLERLLILGLFLWTAVRLRRENKM